MEQQSHDQLAPGRSSVAAYAWGKLVHSECVEAVVFTGSERSRQNVSIAVNDRKGRRYSSRKKHDTIY